MNYDIIIVGAGISGAVIAEQYANKLNKKVLVIERWLLKKSNKDAFLKKN